MKKALISVSDKTNIVEFAKNLIERNFEIVATGNTYLVLVENDIPVSTLESITNFEEMLDGRVKTLHPNIHAGILFKRNNNDHVQQLEDLKIDPIDMVVVNLYPFENNIHNNLSDEEMFELIDIGGPTMLRSAAKNYQDVLVVCDPDDYETVIKHLDDPIENFNRSLALKVFNLTAHYDTVIQNYFQKDEQLQFKNITLNATESLRYGENPHQQAAYCAFDQNVGFNDLQVYQGKQLSYNNYLDANASLEILNDFKDQPVIFSLKHTNTCSIALGNDLNEMFDRVYKADPISIFGGIVATNQVMDEKLAETLSTIFLEIVIAKDFTEQALEIFSKKKNLRVIKYGNLAAGTQYRSVMGGLLIQDSDTTNVQELDYKVVSNTPLSVPIDDVYLAASSVKHIKSNGITIVSNNTVVGVGCGQVNRVQSARIALGLAKDYDNLVMGSDAFLPFDDVVRLAHEYGVKVIVQPGGSIKDQVVIDTCNELGICLIFTGVRNFKH